MKQDNKEINIALNVIRYYKFTVGIIKIKCNGLS